MAEKKSNYKILHTLEERFMIVSLLQGDLSRFPLEKGIAHFATDKDKARMFAEVFTPLHLVDEIGKDSIRESSLPKTGTNIRSRLLICFFPCILSP